MRYIKLGFTEMRLALNENNLFCRLEHLRYGPHVIVSIDMPLNHVLGSFARKAIEPVARTDRSPNVVSFDFFGLVVAVCDSIKIKLGTKHDRPTVPIQYAYDKSHMSIKGSIKGSTKGSIRGSIKGSIYGP
jgi:hypothetical protein